MLPKIPDGLKVDAIQLKSRCQEAVLRDTGNLTPMERRSRLETWLAGSDSPLADFWRRMEGHRAPGTARENQRRRALKDPTRGT